MTFASAISTHPVTVQATGEAIGQILEQVGSQRPDLVCAFVSRGHAGALEDIAATIRRTLSPGAVLGCAAESVVGNGLEVEDAPAISLWAGGTGPVIPVRVEPGPAGVTIEAPATAPPADTAAPADTAPAGATAPPAGTGTTGALPGGSPAAALVLADPFGPPASSLLGAFEERFPGVPVIGGLASGAFGPGGSRLLLDRKVHTTGAVGVLLGEGAQVSAVVSQGCRPIGRPLVVTRAEGSTVYELAGRPALDRLVQMARETMTDEDIRLVNQGLQLGIVVDEHKVDFGPGDFLVRNVLGADQSNGAVVVGEEVGVGTTVQFHVRDAASADVELHLLLEGRQAEGVLLFTCNGRGRRLFGTANHDAAAVADDLDGPATAGFLAAGELGPLGDRNFLHAFSASMALFGTAGKTT